MARLSWMAPPWVVIISHSLQMEQPTLRRFMVPQHARGEQASMP
jgi:hypothetical protein